MYYEQTQQVRIDLLHIIETLKENELKKKLDGWTIGEILEHLYITERKFVSIIKEAVTLQRTRTDKTNPHFDLSFLMDRTRKISAPDYLCPTSQNYSKTELIQLLSESREELEEFVKSTNSEERQQISSPHRWMGDLTVEKWIELIGFHEKRHILQIEEILQSSE